MSCLPHSFCRSQLPPSWSRWVKHREFQSRFAQKWQKSSVTESMSGWLLLDKTQLFEVTANCSEWHMNLWIYDYYARLMSSVSHSAKHWQIYSGACHGIILCCQEFPRGKGRFLNTFTSMVLYSSALSCHIVWQWMRFLIDFFVCSLEFPCFHCWHSHRCIIECWLGSLTVNVLMESMSGSTPLTEGWLQQFPKDSAACFNQGVDQSLISAVSQTRVFSFIFHPFPLLSSGREWFLGVSLTLELVCEQWNPRPHELPVKSLCVFSDTQMLGMHSRLSIVLFTEWKVWAACCKGIISCRDGVTAFTLSKQNRTVHWLHQSCQSEEWMTATQS